MNEVKLYNTIQICKKRIEEAGRGGGGGRERERERQRQSSTKHTHTHTHRGREREKRPRRERVESFESLRVSDTHIYLVVLLLQ